MEILRVGNLIGEAQMKVSLDVVNFKEEMKRVKQEVANLGNIGIEERVDYATNTLRQVTPVDTGKARSGWYNEKYKDSNGYLDASIINEVEYIDRLNKGHSKQAPRYFIEQVLVRIGILTPN
jgi:putative heme iron utilization protein